MNQNYWLIILFVAAMVCNEVKGRPRDVDLTNVHPVYKSVETGREVSNSYGGSEFAESKSKSNGTDRDFKFNIEAIATVARASNNGPPAQPTAVIDHLVDAVSQMVESDIRTPPRLKEILKEKNTDRERERVAGIGFRPMPVTFVYEDEDNKPEDVSFVGTEKVLQTNMSVGKASVAANSKVTESEGVKGVAIPVVMDDGDEIIKPVKKLQKISETVKSTKDDRRPSGITKIQATTTPSSGLSTWILLSDNRDVTTPTPGKSNKRNGGTEEKKTAASTTSSNKKPTKVQTTTAKNAVTLKKGNSKLGSRRPETETTSALEALVETQKKSLTTSTTSKPPKASGSRPNGPRKPQTDSKKKFTEKMDVAETKDRVEATASDTKIVYTIPPHFVVSTSDPVTFTDQNEATENVIEGTTKKKKSSAKKKKNKKKKKKPDTEIEPKIPSQPVGSQIYNFLSREIVPTVGLGLIGVALTAGLASFLGYNPFVSSAIPLRRTYETSHGYSPSNYYNYNYNTDYNSGGQSEEVLLREVLLGMPEESRYGLTHGDSVYSDSYNRNDRTKSSVYTGQTGSTYNLEKDSGKYDSTYSQDYSTGTTYDASNKKFNKDYSEKYPVYTRETGTSFVYPETPAMTVDVKGTRQGADASTQVVKSAKTNAGTAERQPEAIYTVKADDTLQYRSGESAVQRISPQNSWHRIGTPMDSFSQASSRVEPEPRSLNLSELFGPKERRRTKRETGDSIQRIARKRTKKETDAENEIDVGDSTKDHRKGDDDGILVFSSNTQTPTSWPVTSIDASTTTTTTTSDYSKFFYVGESSTKDVIKKGIIDSTEDKKEDESSVPFPIDDDTGPGSGSNASFLDILKRLAQFKLRLGLNFLRSTTDMFSRYLDVIQRKVDESLSNTTTVQYNRRRSPWSRIFFGRKSDSSLRKRRSALEVNPLLTTLLAEESKLNDGQPKSTKKELTTSDKIFFTKKSVPKKYQPKTGH